MQTTLASKYDHISSLHSKFFHFQPGPLIALVALSHPSYGSLLHPQPAMTVTNNGTFGFYVTQHSHGISLSSSALLYYSFPPPQFTMWTSLIRNVILLKKCFIAYSQIIDQPTPPRSHIPSFSNPYSPCSSFIEISGSSRRMRRICKKWSILFTKYQIR